MEDIWSYVMHLAAVPLLDFDGIQHIKVFVGAVYKADVIFFLAELFKDIYLIFWAVPEEAEITADNKSVALLQVFKARIAESRSNAMSVTGNVYLIFTTVSLIYLTKKLFLGLYILQSNWYNKE